VIVVPKHLDPASLDRMLKSHRPIHREECLWYKDVGEMVAMQSDGFGSLYLEFGTASGVSARWLAGMSGIRGLCCFDTFEGLPETWGSIPAGAFTCHGQLPMLPLDCRVIKGLFQDTLPGFLAEHPANPVAFIHIDCDLYSSTAFVLEHVAPHLTVGSVLVFDDLFDYQGLTIDHEAKAFVEWYRECPFDLELVMTCNDAEISGKAFLRVVDTKTIRGEKP